MYVIALMIAVLLISVRGITDDSCSVSAISVHGSTDDSCSVN